MEKYSETVQPKPDFADIVHAGVDRLAEMHDGPLVVLFDIDDTLVFGLPEVPREEYVRDDFLELVQSLHQQYGERIDFGVLTMRRSKEFQPSSPHFRVLEPIAAVINPIFLTSSSFEDFATQGLFDFSLQQVNYVPRHLDATVFEEHDYAGQKDIVLDRLLREHKQTGFIVVDDMPWVLKLSSLHSRAEGVYVG